MRVALRALLDVFEKLEARPERTAQERLWMERRAEVRPGDVLPANDERPPVEARALVGRQPRAIRLAVRREEQQAARPQDTPKLRLPRELEVLGEVGEDGE